MIITRTCLAACLAAALLVTPVPAQAPPTIALLSIGTDPVKPNPVWVAFLDQFAQLGYVEGRTIAIERRFAGGQQERLADFVADLAKRKDRPVIVYDDAGERAAKAAAALRKHGFTRVATLSGGIGAWQQAGLPVEK